MRIIHLFGLLVFFTSVYAGQVTVPNTFTSGTAAVAADVNDNFQTLADGINVNDTNIGINTDNINTNANVITTLQATIPSRVVDGNSADLGRLLDHSGKYITFQTSSGYIAPFVYLADGRLYDSVGNFVFFYYESINCTGIPYVNELTNGVIFAGPDGNVSYTDINDTGSDIVAKSNNAGGNCNSFPDNSMTNVFAVYNNDPAVTSYSGPITLPIRIK